MHVAAEHAVEIADVAVSGREGGVTDGECSAGAEQLAGLADAAIVDVFHCGHVEIGRAHV